MKIIPVKKHKGNHMVCPQENLYKNTEQIPWYVIVVLNIL